MTLTGRTRLHFIGAAFAGVIALEAGCSPSAAESGGVINPEKLIQKCMGISNWSAWSDSASSGGWQITRREDNYGEYINGLYIEKNGKKHHFSALRQPDMYKTSHIKDRLQRCETSFVFNSAHDADIFITKLKGDLHLKPSPSGDTYTSVLPSGEKIRMLYDKNAPGNPSDSSVFFSAVIHNDPKYIKS